MPLLDRLRLFLVALIAMSVSLPMAWISLGKLALFGACMVVLTGRLFQNASDQALKNLWTVRLVIAIVAIFGLSMLWTQAPTDIAALAIAKHGKLIEIAMLATLIRTRRDAMLALSVFALSQTFFIASSWLMIAGFRVPWATSQLIDAYKHVVYSTYLDQTLMFAASAAVLWHLRGYWPQARRVAGGVALAAIANVLFFQDGKTGYLAALTVLTLIAMWQIPRRWRLLSLVIAPTALALLAYGSSPKIQSKVDLVWNQSQAYNISGNSASSSGFRLHAWRRSVQAIAESPLHGHGVGSWTATVKRLEGARGDEIFGTSPSSNSHQEYLLWGVELGLGGSVLLVFFLVSLVRDAMQFPTPVMRAIVSVTAVMAVGCMFNSSLYDALIGDYFCITLGVLLALGLRTTSNQETSR